MQDNHFPNAPQQRRFFLEMCVGFNEILNRGVRGSSRLTKTGMFFIAMAMIFIGILYLSDGMANAFKSDEHHSDILRQHWLEPDPPFWTVGFKAAVFLILLGGLLLARCQFRRTNVQTERIQLDSPSSMELSTPSVVEIKNLDDDETKSLTV